MLFLNPFHSKLNLFHDAFKIVSTKYLNNYLTMNIEVEGKQGRLSEKVRRLQRIVAAALFKETDLFGILRPSLSLLVRFGLELKHSEKNS